jgi:hypothetical protein
LTICRNLSTHKIKGKSIKNKAYSSPDGITHNNLCLAQFILAYKLESETQNKYFTKAKLATSAFTAPFYNTVFSMLPVLKGN